MRRNTYFTALSRKQLLAPGNLARGVVAAMVAVVASGAGAHPHAWIDVGTTFVTSDAGQVTAIRQEWLYDNLLSDGMLDALKEEGGGTADLQAYAAETMDNLKSFGYFMRVTAGDTPMALRGVTAVSGKRVDDEIHVEFTATLAQPVRVAGAPVVVKVFDPTYFIEILQDPDEAPQVANASGDSCTVELEYPQPSPSDYARALAIDSGLAVEPEFGELFAEEVHLVCL